MNVKIRSCGEGKGRERKGREGQEVNECVHVTRKGSVGNSIGTPSMQCIS